MHQICDGYNPRVRMGNWFEESYSVKQLSRENPQKKSRDAEIDIGYIDAQNKLRPLNRMARMAHWNTSGLVEAPQFQSEVKKTTAKENYDVGVVGHFFKQWKPMVFDKNYGSNTKDKSSIKVNKCTKEFRMFNEQNINELLNQREANTTSFKSGLVPNKHIEPEVLLQTIYQRDIADKMKGTSTQQNMNTKTGNVELERPVFRRIRSQITMRNVPLISTNK